MCFLAVTAIIFLSLHLTPILSEYPSTIQQLFYPSFLDPICLLQFPPFNVFLYCLSAGRIFHSFPLLGFLHSPVCHSFSCHIIPSSWIREGLYLVLLRSAICLCCVAISVQTVSIQNVSVSVFSSTTGEHKALAWASLMNNVSKKRQPTSLSTMSVGYILQQKNSLACQSGPIYL